MILTKFQVISVATLRHKLGDLRKLSEFLVFFQSGLSVKKLQSEKNAPTKDINSVLCQKYAKQSTWPILGILLYWS